MKKIMIVDDEKISLMMAEHILSTEYQTVCVSSGDEAISTYMKEHPDMVLSDLHMPGISGYELQMVLQEKTHDKIPFMFMTADKDEETEQKGLANGAMDFIRKPFRADVLIHRVENILRTIEQIQGLKKAASTDPMTGLLNKASSEKEIDKECKSSAGAMMMIDLDNFKLVNDIYGHDMGDKVLIRFAEIIQSAIRSTDIAGRLGGDEFIAFCKNISDESVIADKAAYINEQVLLSAKEYMGKDMTIPLGASIGCVFVPDEGKTYKELYKKADLALYDVKQHGKHGYRIYRKNSEDGTDGGKERSDLAEIVKIYSERNVKPGAYLLPSEQFRTVFRFLRRFIGNYKKEVWMLEFSAHSDKLSGEEFDRRFEKFISVSQNSLRQSDIITQNGENKIIILLLETTSKNIDTVISRIIKNWEESEFTDNELTLSYEKEILQ